MIKHLRSLVIAFIVSSFVGSVDAISSLAPNDPYPVYSAVYDPYLLVWQKEDFKGCPPEIDNFTVCEGYAGLPFLSFSISPFYQKATRGGAFDKMEERDHQGNLRSQISLGDIHGRWNMLGLLYGGIPTESNACGNLDLATFPNSQLGNAKVRIFSDLMSKLDPSGERCFEEVFADTIISITSNESFILTDSRQEIGWASAPFRYRKVGVRVQAEIHPFENVGFTIQAGFSEIRQTMTCLIDLGANRVSPCEETMDDSNAFNPCNNPANNPFPNNFFRNIPILEFVPTSTCQSGMRYTECECVSSGDADPCSCTTPYIQIRNQLMDCEKSRIILREIGLDDCNFEETSLEDTRMILWWRHPFQINRNANHCEWPWFIITPALSFNTIAPSGKSQNRKQLLSLPFGNDKHWSVGGDAYLQLDFVETIMIAGGLGFNYFFPRDIKCIRIPTSCYQSGIFPYAAEMIRVKPGLNFNYNAVLSAYHFISKLSATVEWILVKHEQDEYEPLNMDPTIFTEQRVPGKPDKSIFIEKAECITKFNAHFVNASLYYDISPNITIGALAQFPLSQRGAYRSTTWMGTFRAAF